jgi:alpha-mannosidase
VEKVFDGTDACAFRVTSFMPVPENLVVGKVHNTRSETLIPLEISSTFTLNRSDEYITVNTTVKNTAKDHRLRIFFNTGIPDNHYFVSQTQAILQRAIDRGEDTYDWKESGIPEQQFEDIAFKRNADKGLAFISAGGLHEVSADKSGGLYITLFRSFSKTVGTNGETDGQLPGDLEFRYSLLPLNSKHTNAEIQRTKDRFVYGVRAFTKQNAAPPEPGTGFELLSDTINFDVLKPAPEGGEGLVVRFTNYSSQTAQGRFVCPRALKSAAAINFLGEVLDIPVSLKDTTLIFEMGPQKIQSYLLHFV